MAIRVNSKIITIIIIIIIITESSGNQSILQGFAQNSFMGIWQF